MDEQPYTVVKAAPLLPPPNCVRCWWYVKGVTADNKHLLENPDWAIYWFTGVCTSLDGNLPVHEDMRCDNFARSGG